MVPGGVWCFARRASCSSAFEVLFVQGRKAGEWCGEPSKHWEVLQPRAGHGIIDCVGKYKGIQEPT